MSVIVVLEMQLKPGVVAGLKDQIVSILPDTRGFEGCEWVNVHQNQDDPDNLVALEKWESRAHYEKYFAWRTETGVIDQLNEISVKPLNVRYYDDIEG